MRTRLTSCRTAARIGGQFDEWGLVPHAVRDVFVDPSPDAIARDRPGKAELPGDLPARCNPVSARAAASAPASSGI